MSLRRQAAAPLPYSAVNNLQAFTLGCKPLHSATDLEQQEVLSSSREGLHSHGVCQECEGRRRLDRRPRAQLGQWA